jgi:nucleoside-diphosphate-sugar epimerase
MKILVLGSTGYVGSMLCKALAREHIPYVEIIRKDGCFKTMNMTFESLEDCVEVLQDQNITHVVNLAASTNKNCDFNATNELIQANVNFTSLSAVMALKLSIPNYVFISTYSTSIGNGKYDPQTLYAATKKSAEDILYFFSQSSNLNVVVLNLYDVYGPNHPHGKVITGMLEALMTKSDFQMSQGNQEVSPIYIDDVTEAIIQTLKQDFAQNFIHFDLLGPEIFKLGDLPDKMALVTQLEWSENQLKRNLPARPREIMLVRPQHGLPFFWNPKIGIMQGLELLAESIKKNISNQG